MAFFRLGKEDLFAEPNLERARDDFLKSFVIYPPAYVNWYYLGVCSRGMGQSAMSAQAFKRFLVEHQRWTSGAGSPEFKLAGGVGIWCTLEPDMIVEAVKAAG